MKTIARYSEVMHRWIVICTLYGEGDDCAWGVYRATTVRVAYRGAYRRARIMRKYYGFTQTYL